MRILLVDDEVRLLDGLRRSLRLERPEWDVATADSGLEACERLQQASYDLLITDMLMPGMDGAGLLREARRVAPGMVRIVLSGHAGRDRIQSCESSFHQFLGKPVDPDRFIALVDGFDQGRAQPGSAQARALVAGLDRIPSLPSRHQELSSLLGRADPPLDAVAALVQRDLGMASKVLKLVNASYLTPDRKVTDLSQAVDLIGLDLLKQAVLEREALSVAEDLHPAGLDLAGLWHHSVQVAETCAFLARLEGLGAELAAFCHTAGLLHDLGRVVLATHPGLGYERLLRAEAGGQQPLTALEMEAYGTTHAAVGAELLHLWGLEPVLCDLVRTHHARLSDDPSHRLDRLLRFADQWCSEGAQDDPFADGLAHAWGHDPSAQRWAEALATPSHP